jgi:hypothetical protein
MPPARTERESVAYELSQRLRNPRVPNQHPTR